MVWYESAFRWYDSFWMFRSPAASSEPIVPTTTVAPLAQLEDTDHRYPDELVLLSFGIIFIAIVVFKPEVVRLKNAILKMI